MKTLIICLFITTQVASAVIIVTNATRWIDCTLVRTNGLFEGGEVVEIAAKRQTVDTNAVVVVDE